jgi:hypothetical protein
MGFCTSSQAERGSRGYAPRGPRTGNGSAGTNLVPRRLIILLAAAAILLIGCPKYTVTNETTPTKPFRNGAVFIGWLTIDESNWQDYGYSSEEDFHKAVVVMNREALQGALKDQLGDRRVIGAKGPGQKPPREAAVAVLFEDTTTHDVAGRSTLTIWTEVKFVDLKRDEVMYSARVAANTRGMSGYASYNLEWCLEQAATNLAGFVKSRFE